MDKCASCGVPWSEHLGLQGTCAQLANHKQLLSDQCQNEQEARAIATKVIGKEAAFGSQDGVPTIADVVEAMGAKYRRAIKELRRVEWQHEGDGCCPSCGHPSEIHFSDCERAAILAEAEETK